VIFFAGRAYIRHLEAEIAWYRTQMIHERQRAEKALDRLLEQRGIGPITVPTPEEIMAAVEDNPVERLMRDPEFASAGSAE